jgi:biopolymer transport protein ExbD
MAVNIDKGSALDGLNLTPLIDVVFLLLIFFLVSTKFAEEDYAMRMPLPEASEAMPSTSTPDQTYINIDAAGRYFVGGKVFDMADLDQILKQAWVNNPGRASVCIRADERCQSKWLVGAANACLKADIRNFTVATRKAGE